MFDQEIIYEYLIDVGNTLRSDPLSEIHRTNQNRVSRCSYALFVAREDDRFKAYSDAIIASGYAAILVDVFNNTPPAEASLLKLVDHMQSDELLLFSTDYPHAQFDGMAALPEGLGAELARKIAIDNPRATYARLMETVG